MKTYRVAIVGCGERGTAAGRAYHAHPRTEVVGLCDLDRKRLGALGDELGIAARYEDLDAMIVETKPDIVAISTGTEFHHPLSMRALEHGVHVEVEKPICVDYTPTKFSRRRPSAASGWRCHQHRWRTHARHAPGNSAGGSAGCGT